MLFITRISVQLSSLFNKQFSEVVRAAAFLEEIKPGSKLLTSYGWRNGIWWK